VKAAKAAREEDNMDKLSWVTRTSGVLLLWAVAAAALPAQTLTTLHSFQFTDGASPEAGLVQATNGELYGTTAGGTDTPNCDEHFSGCGTVFQITTSGALTPIYYFICGPDCDFGNSPEAGLVQGTDGNLYGTTYFANLVSYGAIFEITTGGTVATAWFFSGNFGGMYPASGLVQDPINGNLYGTTTSSVGGGLGTVYSIPPSGGGFFSPPTTLHTFSGTDGSDPTAGLILGTDGNFYGTTFTGGTHNDGTIFDISASGNFSSLASFDGVHGSGPSALVQGNTTATIQYFYGTTSGGGTYGFGTVFAKNVAAYGVTTLYSFCTIGGCLDGANPEAGLVLASDGNLYGTTSSGGTYGFGTIFRISTSGNFTSLYSFGGTDGSDPVAALIQDTNGIF
jgi:uncharacterized repeat protein (TIGR03803 family)